MGPLQLTITALIDDTADLGEPLMSGLACLSVCVFISSDSPSIINFERPHWENTYKFTHLNESGGLTKSWAVWTH